MGKGGGKGGKSGLAKAIGIAGMVWGGFAPTIFGVGTTHLMGAIMGLSLGQTIGSALSPQNQDTPASNFDSKMNTVDSGARIPLVYGTRMIGGLQSWHQTNTNDKWLVKDVILGEGTFCGAYGITANGFMLKPNGNIPTVVKQYASNNKWYSSISTWNNPVFGLINWKYGDASVEIRNGGPTGNDKQLILRWNGQEKWITLQSNQDLKADSSNDYNCSFSLLYQYLEGIHYDTNFAAEGWQLVNPVMASDDPETINTHGQEGCYQRPVMFTIGDYRATNDSWVQFFNGTQDAPSYYEKSGGYPNMAYLHSYLKYSDKLGAGNPTVTCIAHGRSVYDTRTGQWGYSENPAMIVRDYLLNKTFGAGHFITQEMLDEDSFKDVANYCDEIITTTDGAGRSIVEPRYRLNIVINDKNTYLQTLQSMLASFVGFIVFTNGKVALKIERRESAVYDFNDDNIIEDSLSYKADSTADSPNKLVMKYIEPVLNWTAAPAVVEDLVDQSASPIGRGKIISKDVELIGVTSQAQALRLGKIYRDIIRLCPITMTFKSGAQAMHLEPGDVVKVSHKAVLDNKEVDLFKDMPVRILEIQEGEGEYTLTCRQYNPSIYDDRFGGNLNIHDYTPTVKPEDVLPLATPQPTNLQLSTVYKQAADGSVRYDLIVSYTLNEAAGVETGLVYFKTDEDYNMSNIGVIPEDVKGDEIGFSRDWQYAGDSPTKFIFPNVNIGTTYKIMVRARSKSGEVSAESSAPTATITIARKSTIPNMPSNFSFKFSDPPKFTWDAVTNSDVDFYELRSDKNAGAKDGLITRTTSTSVTVQLTNRTGTLYLFAHNATKKYGYPATLTYNKAVPPTSKAPVLTTKLGGFSIEVDPIPDDCVGMAIYVSAAGSENVDNRILSQNNVYSYMCEEGIYDVQVAYMDIFGEGAKSPVSTITVKVLIDDSFIKDEGISLGKVDKSIQDAIDQGKVAKETITQVVADLNDKTGEGIKNYSALTQMSDNINLRVKKDDVINQINISKESILIDGSKVHVTGDTVFDNNVIAKGMIQAGAITADKLATQDITIGGDTNTTTGIVGGAVRLDKNGLTVKESNGGSVIFNQDGMSFADTLGNIFAGVGRFCTGQVNDGDIVTFMNPWDVIPSVFLFPTGLQTSVVQYTNVNVYQQVMPINISKNGFQAICRSILKAGSGSNIPINNQFAVWGVADGNGKWYRYDIVIPEGATSATISFQITTAAAMHYFTNGQSNLYRIGSTNASWEIKLDNIVAQAEYGRDEKSPFYISGPGHKDDYGYYWRSKTVNKIINLSFSNKKSLTLTVQFTGGGSSTSGSNKHLLSTGSATLFSYSFNTAVDTVIARGSCGFIAVDPNTVPFTVTKGQ